MGKTYSVEKKTEEIVIAQNGANEATTSHIEQILPRVELILTIIGIIITIYAAYRVFKKCKQGTRKMLNKEMSVWHSANNIAMGQQQMPTARHIV